MRSRRHSARWIGLTRFSVLFSIVAILTLLLAGAAFAGYRYEQGQATRILPGVRIEEVDVGGMTRAEAERAVSGRVGEILSRPIQVRVPGREWELSAQTLGTRVDVDAALNHAMAVSDSFGWPSRLYHRLLDKPIVRSFDIPVSYDDSIVTSFVGTVAKQVHRLPQDASMDFVNGRLLVQHSKAGQSLKVKAAESALQAAVRGTVSSLDLPVKVLNPDVSDKTLGKSIILRLSQNRLYLYDGVKVEKTYSVATGQLGIYPTPQGHFMIVNKRINPTWVNPARDTWGAGEPDFIPPGPDNPLGTRAMDLSAPGIRIHGTPADYSIGYYASHGCIRMHIWEAEDLFNRVQVGTPVIIAW
ncbi:MAG TPA: L,D-transpeptidase family protein [Actinomycetota bacterium]